MDQNYLQFNFVNMVTVVLMVAVGMIFVGTISSGVNRLVGRSGD